MKIAAIIPARGGSKRLKNKNIYPLLGKPLIGYSIDACLASNHIDHVFVSSDDSEILRVATMAGAIPLQRDARFADDRTPKITAIRAAVQQQEFREFGPFDVYVIAQANSPQLSAQMLDKGIEFLIDNHLWEVMSADANGIQNAAFRIIRSEHLNNDFLSAHCGFIVASCMDVHTLDDIQELTQQLLSSK